MLPHKPQHPTHSMSTTHQARQVGQLTPETRHSVMGHVLMHKNSNKTDLHIDASSLPTKERNNDNHTTCWITSHGRQGHSLPQGHPPPTTSKLPLQTNSVLSIVMSTSSKRDPQQNTQSNRLQAILQVMYFEPTRSTVYQTVSYFKLDQLWISLLYFLQEKQKIWHSLMSVGRYAHLQLHTVGCVCNSTLAKLHAHLSISLIKPSLFFSTCSQVTAQCGEPHPPMESIWFHNSLSK